MRIAISGTHCSGKSTLAEDFVAEHREYVIEPEPYEWLTDLYGEAASDEPSSDDFLRQLELSVERLSSYPRGAKVIAERSPLDFQAYILALEDLGRSGRDCEMNANAVELVAAGLAHVDLLVVLPLDDAIAAPASEDLELREAMNERLLDLIAGWSAPRIVEIRGTREQRLWLLEAALR